MSVGRWVGRSRTAEAMILLTGAQVLRRALPMRIWQRAAGRVSAADATVVPRPERPTGVELQVAIAIKHGVARLKFAPTCLDQALAGRWMLRRRGSRPVLVIGLRRGNLADTPHAWLIGEDGGTVAGAQGIRAFAPVTEFR